MPGMAGNRSLLNVLHARLRSIVTMVESSEKPVIPYGPHRKPWMETVSEKAVSAVDGKLLVSAPSADPLQHDCVPTGITSPWYQVPSSGLTREERDTAMEETVRLVSGDCMLRYGYMVSQGFRMPSCLQSPLTAVEANSGGDPFTARHPLYIQPQWIERNVLDYYASLWNAKWPHDPSDPESYWGYVLTMGSTEGNMHALWSARKYLSGKCVQPVVESEGQKEGDDKVHMALASSVSGMVPVVLFSRISNFSISKLCDIVSIPTFDAVGREMYPNENPLGGNWVQGVPCTGGDAGPGAIDINALERLVDFFSSKGHPIVVIFNYGTTLKGACDDVQAAGERLVKILRKNNMYERTLAVDPYNPTAHVVRRGFWFHVDGALSAAYMPFLEMAYKNGLTDVRPASVFDFRLGFISSIVMSGHKYIGTPWPCGVYLMQKMELLPPQNDITIVGSRDITISVSRNAHSAVLLWSYISTNSYDAQVTTILECFRVLTYTLGRFKELQNKVGIDLWVMNTLPSLSIIFRQPNLRIVLKYSLTTSSLCIDSEERQLAQMFVMKHVTTEGIDAFMEDLQAPDAFKKTL